MTTYEHTLALVRAGASVIHIASFEWERVRGWCIGLAQEMGVTLKIWSSSSGLLVCDSEGVRAFTLLEGVSFKIIEGQVRVLPVGYGHGASRACSMTWRSAVQTGLVRKEDSMTQAWRDQRRSGRPDPNHHRA
jgi:hypothetical protein